MPSTSVSYGNFVTSSEPNPNEEPQNILGLDEEARKRQRQLWEEEEEKNRQKSKVHYQDILYQGRIFQSFFCCIFRPIELLQTKIEEPVFKNSVYSVICILHFVRDTWEIKIKLIKAHCWEISW